MSKTVYEFDEFRFDPVKRRLWRAGEPVNLLPKAAELLHVLLAERGRLLEKDELLTRVWADTIVEEANLSVTMSALRKALGESAQENRFIVTVPRRGYRFVAEVHESVGTETTVIVEERSVARVVVEEEIETERQRDGEMGGWGDGVTGRIATSSTLTVAPSPRRFVAPSRLAIALLSFALLAGAAYWWRARQSQISNSNPPTAAAQPAIHSLAVLPFKSLTPKTGDEYLGVGLADVLITRLSNLSQLTVRPTRAVLSFGDKDAQQAGRALQVDSVLDGSIQTIRQQTGDRVRVTVRLLRTSDGQALWAYQDDEQGNDVFQLQDLVASNVTRALALRLTGAEQQRLERRYTSSTAAQQAYLKGRYHWQRWNEDGLKRAVESFEQARAADPNFALAFAGLADAWNLLGYLSFVPPREAFPKSEAAAREALRLDDQLGEAHLVLAKVRLFYDWDWSGYEHEWQRARELNPNYWDVYGVQGTYLTIIGKFDEAITVRKQALALDPSSPLLTVQVGWPHFYARRYDEAQAWYKRALELDPNFAQAHNDSGLCAAQQGRNDQAVNEWLKARELNHVAAETLAALRQAFATQGIQGFRQKDLELTLERMKQQRVRAWQMAQLYHALGDRAQTFVWLEKAYAERDGLLPFLNVMPQYADLHDDPRFADLVRRIGLAN